MAMDLALYPILGDFQDPIYYDGIITLTQHLKFYTNSYSIFNQLRDDIPDTPDNITLIRTRPLPPDKQVAWVRDGNYWGRTRLNGMGVDEEITWAYAEELARLDPMATDHDQNKAIITWLRALPPKTIIILYWS